MRAARAYQSVDRHTAVIGGNQIDLVILLYDKLLQRFREIRVSIEGGEIVARGQAVGKAIELIESGLIACLDLDQGGELAKQLRAHYSRWMTGLLRCNLNSDLSLLEKIEHEVKEILSAWRELKQIQTKTVR
jgi:flagellar protein FliS